MWKQIIIPSVPPFVLNDARVDFDKDGNTDNEHDFVAELESGLENDLKPDDFASQFEEQLEKELLSRGAFADMTLFDLPLHQFKNDDLELQGLDENYDVTTNNNCFKTRSW